jgi:hypothetical protein
MFTNRGQEKLLSKDEADRVFAMTKGEWETKALRFIAPDWELVSCKHETGLQVIGYEPTTEFGVSLQPFYGNDTDRPTMLILGNYYPQGQLVPMTDHLEADIEAAAQQSLGATYSVTVKHNGINNLESLEIRIIKT